MQEHQMQMATYYYSNNNFTTDHIQQYLDENKALILSIVEGQISGKLNECAENQARLQRNLMYLAAIADSHSQYSGMQHQQQQAMYPHQIGMSSIGSSVTSDTSLHLRSSNREN